MSVPPEQLQEDEARREDDPAIQAEPEQPETETQAEATAGEEASACRPDGDEPGVAAQLAEIALRLDALEAGMGKAGEQLSFLPGQIRNLGNRVDAVAVSVSESRLRALLLDLVGLYDLVDQLLRAGEQVEPETASRHLHNYRMLRTQILQVLEVNGLSRIATEGAFKPEVHRAVDRRPCPRQQEAGQIVTVVRPGFRTALQVLRYAEVVVSHYQPPPIGDSEAPPPTAPAASTTIASEETKETPATKEQEHDHGN